MFQDLVQIKDSGFHGFKTIEQLWNDSSAIPNQRGIYLVLTPDSSSVSFFSKGVGGYFKQKDPNVSMDTLQSKWISGCHLIYIGQAGGNGSSATLRNRIRQYLEFGKGKPVGHYGGRYIWQLSNYKNLIIAWKDLPALDPRDEEKNLMHEFVGYYGRLPFANLTF